MNTTIYPKTYANRSSAQRVANRLNDQDDNAAWLIGCGLDGRWFIEDMNTASSIWWTDGDGHTHISYFSADNDELEQLQEVLNEKRYYGD